MVSIVFIDTTSAAAIMNITKLFNITCKYITGFASCSIANAPRVPTPTSAITAIRNSVVLFFPILIKPTINPKINRINKITVVSMAVIKAAKIATIRPMMNAHFPIKSNSILYLFSVVKMRRKVFK